MNSIMNKFGKWEVIAFGLDGLAKYWTNIKGKEMCTIPFMLQQ